MDKKIMANRRMGHWWKGIFRILIFSCSGLAYAAPPDCTVIDLMPKFWHVVDDSRHQSADQQVAEFRRVLGVDQTDLYSESGLGFESPEALNRAILKTVASARERPEPIESMGTLIKSRLPSYIREFRKTFPDFDCNFPIYIVPSLGQLDGAGRVVDHRPALIFGVDNIAAEYTTTALPIFIDHELFHRYHFQVAGFSDDNARHEVIWRTLWAEGLATYVSMALNPPATLQDALFLPKDLVRRAQPLLPSLIGQLYPKLNQVDASTFSRFFGFHPEDGGIPARAGYYIGLVAAQRIARGESLFSLAHMNAAIVRGRLGRALSDMERDALNNKQGLIAHPLDSRATSATGAQAHADP